MIALVGAAPLAESLLLSVAARVPFHAPPQFEFAAKLLFVPVGFMAKFPFADRKRRR
jgi:hypothetical protein